MTTKALPPKLQNRHNEWVRTVRDRATYRSEGPRIIKIGSCRFEYELAPLPNGQYAVHASSGTWHSGRSSAWQAFPTREEALQYALDSARQTFDSNRFDSCATKTDLASCPKMLARLSGNSLFGFEEPDPLPREEWYQEMILDQVASAAHWIGVDIINIFRSGNYKPISKSGSFFDIPVPR